jgi:hypothetical protein
MLRSRQPISPLAYDPTRHAPVASIFSDVTEDWQPLSAREPGKPAALREGVPDGLERPLRAWIDRVDVWLPRETVERLGVLLDIDLNDFWGRGTIYERLAKVPLNDRLLDVADALLYRLSKLSRNSMPSRDRKRARRDLKQLLDDARSVYEVRDDGCGLERRVDPIAADLLGAAVKAAETEPDVGSAPSQLREASDSVRAMHPDTKKAYRMAVTAVESAAHAVIEPNNTKATLGTMLRILDANPAAFEVEIAGKDRGKGPVTPVTGMLRMLWDGQTSRHGSKQATREETREEAEMAVQLASVLLLWFANGMVRRK